MLKKSLPYFIPVILSAGLLTIMLFVWTDRLELLLEELLRPFEIIKIIGVSFLSLVVMRIIILFLRWRNKPVVYSERRIAVWTTLLVSSWMYVTYSQKIIDHVVLNASLRARTAEKLKPVNQFRNGSEAGGLTVEEYEQITASTWFPDAPTEAKNISYSYWYDGFLPDYSFSLSYDLPVTVAVDTMTITKGEFDKSRTVERHGPVQRVTYNEGER